MCIRNERKVALRSEITAYKVVRREEDTGKLVSMLWPSERAPQSYSGSPDGIFQRERRRGMRTRLYDPLGLGSVVEYPIGKTITDTVGFGYYLYMNKENAEFCFKDCAYSFFRGMAVLEVRVPVQEVWIGAVSFRGCDMGKGIIAKTIRVVREVPVCV